MQEAQPASVLSLGAANRIAMQKTVIDASRAVSATTETDEQLMAAFKGGVADAFTTLFVRYKQPLFGFFLRRVADPSQAEELTQETFIAVLRATSRYEASALFRTWLYAIGFKILRAHRRKAAFRAMFQGEQPAGREPAIEDDLDARLLVREAVGKLDPMHREVLLLREFEGLSYAEIAELLRLPVNTVRSRLFRARMALRDLLAIPVLHPTDQDLSVGAPVAQSTINDYSGSEERV
jgi:RNA polymerase sigma-70 factor (ECF subfamily)